MPLSGRQCLGAGAAQVVGDQRSKFFFLGGRGEFLHDRATRGVGDVRLHLAAQGAFAQRQQTTAQVFQRAFFCFAAVLDAEAVKAAEDAVINDADEAVEFEQAVLQRGGGKQDFRTDVSQRVLQGFGDDVAFFIDVAQAVRFVEHDEIPGDTLDVGRFGFGELVGTDDGAFLIPRVFVGFAQGGVVFLFKDDAVQTEFFLYFLMPLFAQVGRGDDKNAAFALCPVLQDDEAGFDGFAQPHFVGKDDAALKRVFAGKEGGFDLMRVEVNLRVQQRACQGFDAAASCLTGEQPGVVTGLLWGERVLRHGSS